MKCVHRSPRKRSRQFTTNQTMAMGLDFTEVPVDPSIDPVQRLFEISCNDQSGEHEITMLPMHLDSQIVRSKKFEPKKSVRIDSQDKKITIKEPVKTEACPLSSVSIIKGDGVFVGRILEPKYNLSLPPVRKISRQRSKASQKTYTPKKVVFPLNCQMKSERKIAFKTTRLPTQKTQNHSFNYTVKTLQSVLEECKVRSLK